MARQAILRATDDGEVLELSTRLSALPFDRQRAVLEAVLSPRMRLFLLTQTVRDRARSVSDVRIDRTVNKVARRARRTISSS